MADNFTLQRSGESIYFRSSTWQPLIGGSDASLKKGQSGHSWILSTGDIQHITDPLMHLSGLGPVDGVRADLSSARGEIQGQTALAIMSSTLLQAQNCPNMEVVFYGDNKGVQQKCATPYINKLKDHRQPNMDLYLEYYNATRTLKKQVRWIKSHQDSGREWDAITDL
jgi:hypothetical protein